MNPRLFVALLIFIGLLFTSLQASELPHVRLDNNPFSRPEILKRKPPPPPMPAVDPLAVEKVELNLTATMVSAQRPMVIVEGELLGIGQRIEGFKLIAVMEGKAVFRRNGRKFTFEINDGQPKQDTGQPFN